MKIMPIQFTNIKVDQWCQLSRQKTVFFFPVGPLEDHGPHLPISLDLLEAQELCLRSAQQLEQQKKDWQAVIMPALPLGLESNTTKFTICVRPHVLRDWLVDSCWCLVKLGFLYFVCFSGHRGPQQLTTIEEAGKILRRRCFFRNPKPYLISASSFGVSYQEVLRSPFCLDPQEHAGQRDTSVALHLVSELVDPCFETLPTVLRPSWSWQRYLLRRMGGLSGYWGLPAQAKQKDGEEILKEEIAKVFPKLKSVFEGASPRSWFRSWYSLLPPNQSFFKAWLLLAFIFLFLIAWGFLLTLI